MLKKDIPLAYEQENQTKTRTRKVLVVIIASFCVTLIEAYLFYII